MSSDSKLKFNTSASSKGAGASVTSETLTMPDHSENHILSVKADSSCSGEVDVELEMSPDGSNWCPAVTRTVTVSAGQSTAARTGNEEYVKLTPDAGEFKNKHTRGGLNFDVNGAVVTPDGSGARDLMDQHIATTKSFNYSQWFKTSEQPSLASDEIVTFAVTVSGGVFNIDGSAQATLNLKEGSTYVFDTSDSSNSGHPLMFSTTANGSHAGGSSYTTGVTTNGVPGNSGSYIRIVVAASAPTLYYYCNNHSGMGGTANTPISIDYKPVLFRHGGYDNFTNAKTIALTDVIGAGTESNLNYIDMPTLNSTTSSVRTSASYNASPWYCSTDSSPTQALPDPANGFAISMWINRASTTSGIGWKFTNILTIHFTNGASIYFQLLHSSSDANSVRRLRMRYKDPSGNNLLTEYTGIQSTLTGWKHLLFYAKGTGSNGAVTASTTDADNNWKIIIDGVELTPAGINHNATLDSSTSLTVDHVEFRQKGDASYGDTLDDIKMDNLAFFKGDLDTAAIASIYANRNNVELATLPTNTKLTTLFKMGDTSGDVITQDSNLSIRNAISTNDMRMVPETGITPFAIAQYSVGDIPYSAGSQKTTQNLVESKSTFSTSANFMSPAYGGTAQLYAEAGSAAETFYGTSGAVTDGTENDIGKHLLGMFSPTQGSSTSRWLFARSDGTQATWRNRGSLYSGYPGMNYVSSGSYVRYHNYLQLSSFVSYSANDGAEKFLSIRADVGSSGYWYVYDGAALNFTKRSDNTSVPVYVNNGYHCAVVYTPPSDITQGIPEANVAVYMNGVRIKIRTTTESGVDYVEGAAPADNLYYGDETYAANSAWAGTAYLDYGTVYKQDAHINNHMDFQRALSESEIQSLYNNGKLLDFANMQTSFPISLTGCVGAYDADVAATGTGNYTEKQGFKDCSGFGKDIWLHYSTGANVTQGLNSPALGFNAAPSNYLDGNFSTSSNLSISGWFKTTDIGTLFSNTGGAAATGFTCEVTATTIGLSFKDGSPSAVVATTDVNDGQWHHIIVTKNTSQEFKIYIDGLLRVTQTATGLTDADLKGDNGFTLLGDGQENAHATSPASTDSSKLNATVSNWSIHTEVLSATAVSQLYSNGHVRNIKNLPSVTSSAIKAWWQLADPTNPQNDLIGTNNLVYLDGSGVNVNNSAVKTATNTTSGNCDFESNDASLFGGTVMPDYQGAWSLSFWVNIPSNGSSFDTIIGQHDVASTNRHFKIFQLSGNLTFSLAFNNNGLDLSVPFTTYNTWKHVVISKSAGEPGASNTAIYIDGVSQSVSATYNDNSPARGTTNHWGTTATSRIRIGAHSWSYTNHNNNAGSRTGRVFKVDELAGYSKTLSEAEAQVIYNSGNWHLLNNLASSYNLESYYRFGNGTGDVTSGGLNIKDQVVNSKEITVKNSDDQAIITLTSSDTPFRALAATSLVSKLVTATGATYVNGSINGNAMTMSLTKSFNFTTKKWVSTADQDLALCLSFNGFEEQAEYFAIWKCSQTIAGSTIDICDGGWHNVILSYRGRNNLSGDNVDPGDTVKFGPGPAGSLPYNWALSFDGQPLTAIKDGSGADYVGGLNTIVTDTYNTTSYNVGFAIQDRHLKYQTANTEEEYKPHAQFSAGIHEVVGVDNKNAFQGSVDETSFHSDTWWVDQAGTSIITNTLNAEKPATIFGNTTALNNRQGSSTDYPQGKPYDLARPERLTTSGLASDIEGSNQYINPNRYDASSNPNGGLEGWWRWGDTPGDCSITINDVKDHSDSINARDITAFGIVTADRVDMTGASESIYLSNRTAVQGSGSASISFPQVIVENIQASICNLRQMASPVLKYLRVKFTGAGTCNLGENSVQAQINFEIKD